jgi:hypothetical protein
MPLVCMHALQWIPGQHEVDCTVCARLHDRPAPQSRVLAGTSCNWGWELHERRLGVSAFRSR